MKRQDISPFKRAILLTPLITLGCIVGLISLFAVIKLIITAMTIEAFLSSKGAAEYCLTITLVLSGFIIEMFFNKIRRKRYEEESSEYSEMRW